MSDKKDDHDRLVVKRVVNAQVWFFLDNDLIKALSNDIPINMTLDEDDKKIVKEALRTKGEVIINFVRKDVL
jgi:hypothetical protein